MSFPGIPPRQGSTAQRPPEEPEAPEATEPSTPTPETTDPSSPALPPELLARTKPTEEEQTDKEVPAPDVAEQKDTGKPDADVLAAREREQRLEQLVQRAFDRQEVEQRALRDSIRELTESVQELADQASDTDAFAEQVESGLRRSSEKVIGEVRDLRDAVLAQEPPMVDTTPFSRIVAKELDALHESIGSTAADIEGIAQALIDLNAGLRDWAGGVDRNVHSLGQSLSEIRDLALQSGDMHAEVIEELRAQAERAASSELNEQTVADRAEIDQRLKESEELSLYLADQIEDFDRSLQRITDLPAQLEGIVSQALKRTLSAKAKLDKDTEAALADTLAALAENIERMDEAVAHLSSSEESLRALERNQSKLASRVDQVHAELLDRLEGTTGRAPVARAPKSKAKPKPKRSKATAPSETANDLPRARKRPRSKRSVAADPSDDRTDDN